MTERSRRFIFRCLVHLSAAAATLFVLCNLGGCGSVVRHDTLVMHPDSPMLVTEASAKEIRVSVYDSETNGLVDYGWIDTTSLSGWTLSRFDWTRYIEDG